MDYNQRKLSEYIDRLNAEQKPEGHGNPTVSPELGKLYDTVRLVRSLREPALPGNGYPKKLAGILKRRFIPERPVKNQKRIWLAGMAAILALAVMLSSVLPFGVAGIVHAMEEAFLGVKAYHGFIDIIGTNAEGEQNLHAKLEVWADREGRYYVKGLEGSVKDIITVNNGQKKWQVRPEQEEVHVFPAFPDAYRFTFELGKEIEDLKNALSAKIAGEEVVAGRQASILEVSPRGGVPYRIWIDKETKLPLQKQSGMQNALQSTVTYTGIDFIEAMPAEFIAYNVPDGFREINTDPEQLVNSMEEAWGAVGFATKVPECIPAGYVQDGIAVVSGNKLVKLYYTAEDKGARVIVVQGKSEGEFKPAGTAILGKVGNDAAEIQSPVYENSGILGGGGTYAGITDISSIRWRQQGFEYAVVGNAPLEELVAFTEGITGETLEMPSPSQQLSIKPRVEVPVDPEVEENNQKSVDAGNSPWRLDPVHVAQVFISLEISPEGVTGEYPVKYEELRITRNTGRDAIVEAGGDETPIRRVYLKRLVRQDSTGIWTVVGYDPADDR